MTDELLTERKEKLLRELAMISNPEDDNEEELLRKTKKKSKKKKKKASRSNCSSSSESHFDCSRERKKKEKSPELFPSIRDVMESLPQSIDESSIFPSTSTSYDVQDGPSSPPNLKQRYEDLRHNIGRRRSECRPSRSRSRSRFDVPRSEKSSNLPRHDRSLSPKRQHLSPIQPGYDLSLSPQRMSPVPYERPPGPSRRERLLSSSRHSRLSSPPSHKRRLISSRHSRSPSPPPRRRRLSSSRYSRSPSAYHNSELPKRHNHPSSPSRHNRNPSPPSRGGPRTPSPHSWLQSPPRRRPRSPPAISPREKDWYRHRDQSRDERYHDSSPISRSNTHRYRGYEMPERYSTTVYRPKRRSPGPNYSRARPYYSEHRGFKQQRHQKGLPVHSGIKHKTNLGTAVENLNKMIENAAKQILRDLKVPQTRKSSNVKEQSLREMFSTIVTRFKDFVITPDTTNEDIIQQYLDKYSKAEDDLLLEEYCEKCDISPPPAVIPKTEILSPQRDDKPYISPDEEVFIIDDSGYYTKITVNKNELHRYYIVTKKLIKSAKSLMKKVSCYADIKLMTYVMKLRVEERIDEMLKGEKNRLHTKQILEMYRNKYPITGDEEFVTETLHAIWLGKYDDQVRPKKRLKNKSVVPVKQETPDADVKQERPDNGDENEVPQTSASVKQEPAEQPSTPAIAVKTEEPDAEQSEATQSVTIKAEPVDALLSTVKPKTEKLDSSDSSATVVRHLAEVEPAPLNPIEEERLEESVSTITVQTEQAESVDDITSAYFKVEPPPLRAIEAETTATMPAQIKDIVEMPQPLQDTKINSSSNDDGRLTKDDEEVAVIEPETVIVDLCAIEEFNVSNITETVDNPEIQKKIKKEKDDSQNQIKIKKEADSSKISKNIKMETPQMETPKEKNTSNVKKKIQREINTSPIPEDPRKKIIKLEEQKEIKKEVNTDEVAKKMKKEAKSSEEKKKRQHTVNVSEAQTEIENKTPEAQKEIKKEINTNNNLDKIKKRKNIPEEKTNTVEGQKMIEKEIDSESQKKRGKIIDTSAAHKQEKKSITIREEQRETEETINASEVPKVIAKSTKKSEMPQEIKIKINTSDMHKAVIEKIMHTSESQNKNKSEKDTSKLPHMTKNKIILTEGRKELEKTIKQTEVSTKNNDKMDTLEEQEEQKNRTNTSDEPKETEQIKQNFGKQNLIKDSTYTSKIKHETKTAESLSVHQETVMTSNTSEKQMYTIDLLDDDLERDTTKPNIITKDTEDASEAQKVTEPFVIDVSDDEQEPGEPEEYVQRQAADTTDQQQPIVVVDSDSDNEDNGKEPGSYVEISDEESEDAIVRTGFNETPATSKQLSGHHISNPTQESIVQLATTQDSSHDITAPTQNNSNDAPTNQPGGHDITHPTPDNSAKLITSPANSHDITVQTNKDVRTTQPTDKINESILTIDKDTEPNFVNNEPTNVETTNNPTRMESDETTNLRQAETEHNAAESVENIKQFLLSLPI